ncbi:MAG: hypothetical protein ABII75_08790 [Candidatus Omnitrophota bacterium]
MGKIKLYRVIGWIFIAISVPYYIQTLLQSEIPQELSGDFIQKISFFAFIGAMMLIYNVFLWVGILFHWRADRNENPQKKSNWGKAIKILLVLAAVLHFILGYLVFGHGDFMRARERAQTEKEK